MDGGAFRAESFPPGRDLRSLYALFYFPRSLGGKAARSGGGDLHPVSPGSLGREKEMHLINVPIAKFIRPVYIPYICARAHTRVPARCVTVSPVMVILS